MTRRRPTPVAAATRARSRTRRCRAPRWDATAHRRDRPRRPTVTAGCALRATRSSRDRASTKARSAGLRSRTPMASACSHARRVRRTSRPATARAARAASRSEPQARGASRIARRTPTAARRAATRMDRVSVQHLRAMVARSLATQRPCREARSADGRRRADSLSGTGSSNVRTVVAVGSSRTPSCQS